MSSSEIEIILVRHGQTNHNIQKLLQGQIDTPLNDTGRAQAKAAGQGLHDKNTAVDAVWSSDLGRCKETTQLILSQMEDHKDLVVHYEPKLRERAMGELEGMPVKLAYEKAHRENKTLHDFGESKAHAVLRYIQAWTSVIDESVSSNFRRVLVVAHGGVIVGLLATLINHHNYTFSDEVDPDAIKVPHNASFSTVTYNAASKTGVIESFGDTSHLTSQMITTVDQRAL